MIVSHIWFKIPTAISLGVVIAVIATSVIASLLATKQSGKTQSENDREVQS